MKECHYDTIYCKPPIWKCQTCGTTFCSFHYHETSKGKNVECRACERERLKREA